MEKGEKIRNVFRSALIYSNLYSGMKQRAILSFNLFQLQDDSICQNAAQTKCFF